MSSGGSRDVRGAATDPVIALSVSYQRENLLARGLGLEHLREMLIRLARPLVRQGASIAYGGHWKETEDNFTYELLQLISAEQADRSLGGAGAGRSIGRLYNYSPWPAYLTVTPRIEARWVNCCRIVRVTQQHAGFEESEVVPDAEAQNRTDRVIFNGAVTLSAMRRLSLEPFEISVPEVPTPETIPPACARVVLGGKLSGGYQGFLPGIFEEALLTMERGFPLFVLGGFGGAAEALARVILHPELDAPPEFTEAWHTSRNPDLAHLLKLCQEGGFRIPNGIRTTPMALRALLERLMEARAHPGAALHTGLDDDETRELMGTRDMARAVRLVRQGLGTELRLPTL